MATQIAPTAIVDPRAELADDVEIGHYCMIGPKVSIGRGTRLENNVTLTGRTTLGRCNHVFPYTVIGSEPQDLSYRGSDTRVMIGDFNVIRESVTINRATEKEEGVTSIGDRCYLMAGCHVAHDCKLGSRIIMANATLLGGHVHVHDDATFSGSVGVCHFVTIGSFSFIGGLAKVVQDVPPYMLVEGNPGVPRCINRVALARHGFSPDDVRALSEAHRLLYRAKVGLDHAREILRANELLVPSVTHLLSFVQTQHEGRNGRGREQRRAA